jgi:hypothetical protein
MEGNGREGKGREGRKGRRRFEIMCVYFVKLRLSKPKQASKHVHKIWGKRDWE